MAERKNQTITYNSKTRSSKPAAVLARFECLSERLAKVAIDNWPIYSLVRKENGV